MLPDGCPPPTSEVCWCLQVFVHGGEKQVVLKSLQPDTHYSILVAAAYRSKEGGSASAQGKTSESSRH